MERLTLNNASALKQLIFDGLKFQEFTLVARTGSAQPIYLFFHHLTRTVVIYDCKRNHDEMIIVEGHKPDKLKVMIKEYQRHGEAEQTEIAGHLEALLQERRARRAKVIYLTQL